MNTNDRRRRWRQHWKEVEHVHQERERVLGEQSFLSPRIQSSLPDYPTFPEDLADLTCGAKTRAGTPCKRGDLYENGRCRLHGGPSTGPITKRGKRKSAKNGRKLKRTP